MLIEELRKG